jgi:hypothetical protein
MFHLGSDLFVRETYRKRYEVARFKRITTFDKRHWTVVPTKESVTFSMSEMEEFCLQVPEMCRRLPEMGPITGPCVGREDHQNQEGALECPECNPDILDMFNSARDDNPLI